MLRCCRRLSGDAFPSRWPDLWRVLEWSRGSQADARVGLDTAPSDEGSGLCGEMEKEDGRNETSLRDRM
jgi:hypothetical protein